jgi:hypothetical protein
LAGVLPVRHRASEIEAEFGATQKSEGIMAINALRSGVLVVALWSVAQLGAAHAADRHGNFVIRGTGAKSCAQWLEDKKDDAIHSLNSGWVLGYVTALNRYHVKKADVLSDTDPVGFLGWIDKYCAEHPAEELIVVVDTFVIASPADPTK